MQMKKAEETVLLYSFIDEQKVQRIEQVLAKQKIKCKVLADEMYRQKIGYLLEIPGFTEMPIKEDGFVFPQEVMIFYNIKGKRLDQVLLALKNADIVHVKFKAVVTPFNMLWTLRRLCETLQREHAATVNKEDISDEK
jgi:hypothetical protein